MGYASLIQKIVYKISGRPLASSGLYTPSDYLYDYALGGVPFLSATSDTRPDTEGPVQQRKEQFDNYKDPGEYSLNQWWLRSQTSFVGGAGVIYQDPDTQGEAKNIRYHHSIGIDPFSDVDNIQLLKSTVNPSTTHTDTQTTGFMYCKPFPLNGDEWVWLAKGVTVWMEDLTASGFTSEQFVTLPGTANAFITGGMATFTAGVPSPGITVAEQTMVYLSDTVAGNQGIYQVLDGFPSMNFSKAYDVGLFTGQGERVTLASARGLLGFGFNNELRMLDPYVIGPVALPAANAQTPEDQAIVSIDDGPDAVYVGANSSSHGYIYKTTFDNLGIVNGLQLVATLPDGEMVSSIRSYVATYLVITTSNGVRVGTFTGNGIAYSPLIINTGRMGTADGPESGSGFGRIAFSGENAYITTQGVAQHDGEFGIMAINLGTLINDSNTGGVFNAYSTWVYYPGTLTPITDVCTTPSGRVIFTTDSGVDAKVLMEHETDLVLSGYLDTGRCRFNTVEPKLFKYFSVRTPSPLEGEVSVSVLDDGGGITNYVTYGPTLEPGTDDIATPAPTGPRNWEALRFTLRRSATDNTVGGKLDSWQIKALPGTLKQRNIVRQFLCFNSETDKTGQVIAGDTSALDRLTAIRQMCQRGDTVTLQDLVNNISDQVIVDDYQFAMLTTPGPNGENYGGYLTVRMRTVADSVPPISVAGSEDEE